MSTLSTINPRTINNSSAASIEPVDDSLFSFMNESSSHSTHSDAVTAEVDNYLACNSTDTTSLTAFPRVAVAFRNYTQHCRVAQLLRGFSTLKDRFSQPEDARYQTLCLSKRSLDIN